MLLNSLPPETAETKNQRLPGPNRRTAAAAATPTASNTLRAGEPLPRIWPNDGSNRRAYRAMVRDTVAFMAAGLAAPAGRRTRERSARAALPDAGGGTDPGL